MEVYYNPGQKRKGAEALGEKYVLGIGAANVDVHGRSRVSVVMRDSNPGHLHTSVGGVTRNVLENLSRLGVSARMVSAVGDDVYGEMVYRESVSAGQVIGAVGNTSLTESALGAHLHFSVTRDGAAVDPADYLPSA